MTCKRCGSRCQGRYCQSCERDVKHGNAAADQSQPDSQDAKQYECTSCGETYEDDGFSGCPECGSGRRRYIGEVAC